MLRRRKKKAGCMGKRPYSSQTEANAAADKRMLINVGLSLRSYPCRHCKQWHITSKEDRIKAL
jgi:hypothetical protein